MRASPGKGKRLDKLHANIVTWPAGCLISACCFYVNLQNPSCYTDPLHSLLVETRNAESTSVPPRQHGSQKERHTDEAAASEDTAFSDWSCVQEQTAQFDERITSSGALRRSMCRCKLRNPEHCEKDLGTRSSRFQGPFTKLLARRPVGSRTDGECSPGRCQRVQLGDSCD